jgi:hypothetical protein
MAPEVNNPLRPPRRERSENGTRQPALRTLEGDAALHVVKEPVDQDHLLTSFVGITKTTSSKYFGYWVECPLPAYEGMKVLFRTSNQTKVRHERPAWRPPARYEKLRVERDKMEVLRLAMINGEQEMDDTIDERFGNLNVEILGIIRGYTNEFHEAQSRWLSLFVLDFEPWPFEDIQKPNPENPDSYMVLYSEFEDLYIWIINKGRDEAIKASAKNS